MCEILKLWKEEEYEKVLWYDTTRKNAPALVHNSHGIYISGKNGAVDIVKLRALKIGIVVTLCSQQETETHRHLKIVLEGAGITHRVFKAEDDIGFDITSVAQDVAAWINDTVALPNDRALIHCMGGVNRSSAVAITYLAMFKGLPLCEVIWQAMHNCGRILSNAHFLLQVVCSQAPADSRSLPASSTTAAHTIFNSQSNKRKRDDLAAHPSLVVTPSTAVNVAIAAGSQFYEQRKALYEQVTVLSINDAMQVASAHEATKVEHKCTVQDCGVPTSLFRPGTPVIVCQLCWERAEEVVPQVVSTWSKALDEFNRQLYKRNRDEFDNALDESNMRFKERKRDI